MAFNNTFLYRLLREDEYPLEVGLESENPYAGVSIHEHIVNGSYRQTQFISCSASREAVVNFAQRSDTRPARIAAISVAELEKYGEVDIYDLTDPHVRSRYLNTKHANKRAENIQEVLIVGYISPSCIQYVFDIECKYEYLYRLVRNNENPSDVGIEPKNPDADYDVYKFITDGSYISSQFISTSASFKATKRYARNASNRTKRVAKINVRALSDSG